MFILITEAQTTPGGVKSIIDLMPKHNRYFHEAPVSSTPGIHKIETLQASITRKKYLRKKNYCRLVFILIGESHTTTGGVKTIID